MYVWKDALNHFLVHSSSEKLKTGVFFLFCILVDRPMGGQKPSPPPYGYATARFIVAYSILSSSKEVKKARSNE